MATLDTANALTTASTFASVVGASDDDTSLVTMLINQASAWFNTTVGVPLKARATTDYYDGDQSTRFYLKVAPVSSVRIWCDSSRAFTSDTELASTDFVVDNDTGRVDLISGALPPGVATVKAQYTGGFGSAHFQTATLEGECIQLVRFWYDLLRNGRVGVRSISAGGGTTSYLTNIPQEIQDYALSLRRQDGVA